MGKPAVPIELTRDQRSELEGLAKMPTPWASGVAALPSTVLMASMTNQGPARRARSVMTRLPRRPGRRLRRRRSMQPTGRCAAWPKPPAMRLFALPTEKRLRRGVHRSTQGLEQAIKDYIDIVNDDRNPFRWTKSPDQIVAGIKRFCLRTTQTAERQNKNEKTSDSGRHMGRI